MIKQLTPKELKKIPVSEIDQVCPLCYRGTDHLYKFRAGWEYDIHGLMCAKCVRSQWDHILEVYAVVKEVGKQ